MDSIYLSDPLGSFEWERLYDKYDALVKKFNPGNKYIQCLNVRADTDRSLYNILIRRTRVEHSDGNVSLCTYSSILYWKLYSTSISTLVKIYKTSSSVEQTKKALLSLNSILPRKLHRDIDEILNLIHIFDGLQLIGTPTPKSYPARSTILHFIYPDVVPIFDRMVLKAVGITNKSANHDYAVLKKYIGHTWYLADKYKNEISNIYNINPIRAIDMALWIIRDSFSRNSPSNKRCAKADSRFINLNETTRNITITGSINKSDKSYRRLRIKKQDVALLQIVKSNLLTVKYRDDFFETDISKPLFVTYGEIDDRKLEIWSRNQKRSAEIDMSNVLKGYVEILKIT